MNYCFIHKRSFFALCVLCSQAVRVPRRKVDTVQGERRTLRNAGDAKRTELLRKVHASEDGGYADSPIWLSEMQRRRLSPGGLNERLKQAAAARNKAYSEGKRNEEYRCFIGWRFHKGQGQA